MKTFLIITLLFTTQIFANYAFNDEKTVKIDMHGGKSESFSNQKGFSQMEMKSFEGLQGFSIKKPTQPNKPEEKTIPDLKDIELKED